MLLPAAGKTSARAEAAAEAACESDDAAATRKDEGRGCVRARLRARLVDRCKQLLMDALEERHGAQWAEEVLQEGFVVHQAMLRICESFGLRPHLEAQVLWTVRKCALEQSQRKAEASEGPAAQEPPLLPLPLRGNDSGYESSINLAGEPAERGPLAPESDVAWSPTPSPRLGSPTSSAPTSPCLLSSAVPSAGPSPAVAPAASHELPQLLEMPLLPELAPLGAADAWHFKRQSSGEAATSCCASEEPEEFTASSEEDSSVESEESEASQRKAQPGVKEVEARQSSHDPKVAPDGRRRSRPWAWALWAMGGLSGNADLLRGEGAGELPRQLAAADGVPAMADAGAACMHLASVKPAVPALSGAGGVRHKDKAGCSLHFAGSSEVCFFVVDEAIDATEWYQRCIETKGFDGPSGHKARRKRAQTPVAKSRRRGLLSRLGLGTSSMLDNARIEAASELEDEEPESDAEENEDEWQDQCDEIAELMSQQRHTLLWSASW